ncbi:hypothetical protein [Streptomyces albidocamelliae]|uniref:Uncharacterized protein n=1 Tax=Streptomyces albidocamelliae TaxID=2981135 RepID=A0ABY6EZB2_9ACTN|nr:hypothetical protein [Streptomyces sp. HUAS 14-6]UXY39738.1 hypothetical protein N8I86_36540 [Streptomyces sp. HUAS 14-6]
MVSRADGAVAAVSYALTSAVYYAVITPLALLGRIGGARDPLALRSFRASTGSALRRLDRAFGPDDFLPGRAGISPAERSCHRLDGPKGPVQP